MYRLQKEKMIKSILGEDLTPISIPSILFLPIPYR